MSLSRRRALAACCLCPLLAALSAVAGDLDEVRARGRLRVAVWKDNASHRRETNPTHRGV